MVTPGSRPFVSAAEAKQAGAAVRETFPRSALGTYHHSDRDATALIEAQNTGRIPELVPLRMKRMRADPLSFFRGSAALMASDLGREPSSGIEVISCGDAHVGNFGFFLSPVSAPVFDLNDFDESWIAPWEWDVKRLVTSAIIGARQAGFPESTARDAGFEAAAVYRVALAEAMDLGVVDRYYGRVDTDAVPGGMGAEGQRILEKTIRQAHRRAASHSITKQTTVGPDGLRHFVDNPPEISHDDAGDSLVVKLITEYRKTVGPEVAVLLDQFELNDTARRVRASGASGCAATWRC